MSAGGAHIGTSESQSGQPATAAAEPVKRRAYVATIEGLLGSLMMFVGSIGTGWIANRFVTSLQKHSSQRIAALHGGIAALSVSSGAAAVTYAIENVALAGDHIVDHRRRSTSFGPVRRIVNPDPVRFLLGPVRPRTPFRPALAFGPSEPEIVAFKHPADR